MRGDLTTRFWAKVEKTETCWLWVGAKDPDGYGNIGRGPAGSGTARAHRVSWEIHHGPVPDGLCVLHNCPGGDRPSCVNPHHLWLGTMRANNDDMTRKGRRRHVIGVDAGNAKLTEDKVRAIRTAYATEDISLKGLGARHHVHHETVRAVVLRKTWRHVP